MAETPQDLVSIRAEARHYYEISEELLINYIRHSFPLLIEPVKSWLRNRRRIDPAVFIACTLCEFEGTPFDSVRRATAILAGAAAGMADDLIDERRAAAQDVRLLTSYSQANRPGHELALFDAFNAGLRAKLSREFCDRNGALIHEYNRAQIDTGMLLDAAVDRVVVINTKDRVGGYSTLLLHAMMFPDESIACDHVEEEYRPEHVPTKTQALYNFGAWLSRVDDLWDEENDRDRGIKQLATEGIVTWDDLPALTARTFAGLQKYYSPHRVETVLFSRFTPLISERNKIQGTG